MRNQWIVAGFNTANLRLGALVVYQSNNFGRETTFLRNRSENRITNAKIRISLNDSCKRLIVISGKFQRYF